MQNIAEMTLSVGKQPPLKAQPKKHVAIPAGAIDTVNQLFVQMRAIFPAWKNSFPDEKSYREAKRQWLETLVNEGITTIDQLQNGLDRAKKSTKPFWPSLGEFVGWCKTINFEALNLPDEEQLYRRVQAFMGCGMENLHEFKFRSAAEYWLITDLYCRNRTGEWSDKTLKEELAKALRKMADRILRQEKIPEPKIALPETVQKRMSQEEIADRWTALRKQLGAGK